MTDHPVGVHRGGPPETVLDPEPAEAQAALEQALTIDASARRDVLASIAARWPRCCEAWARLGDVGRDPIERYAAYRVGYHRGLDRLRQNEWRGAGYVRWRHPENRGFLRALAGLAAMAAAIDEDDEADRCEFFLTQLDPEWPPADADLEATLS